MTVCTIHKDFFDDMCAECKEEYAELKGLNKLYLDTYNKNKIQKNIKNFLKNVLNSCMEI
jgi:hypothetical protein